MSRRRLPTDGRSDSAWELVALIGYGTMKITIGELRMRRRIRTAPPSYCVPSYPVPSYCDRMECHRRIHSVT